MKSLPNLNEIQVCAAKKSLFYWILRNGGSTDSDPESAQMSF